MTPILRIVFIPLGVFAIGCTGIPEESVDVAAEAIIRGAPTPPDRYPATGALLIWRHGRLFPFCTATLIAPDAVLTAAHCMLPFANATPDALPSFTLASDARSVTWPETVQGISVNWHPRFDISRLEVGALQDSYDVGVMRLATPMPEGTPLAVLPEAEEIAALHAGMDLEIVGYGLTNASSHDGGVKFDATTELVKLGKSELQVGRPGEPQNCSGDSGGPAMADLGAGLRVVGLVSRGMQGGEESCNKGGIDTRVDAYLDWISSQTSLP